MAAGDDLPQLDGGLFLTDGGIETDPDLPPGFRPARVRRVHPARRTSAGRRPCAATTSPTWRSRASHDAGFVLESPTWRASPRWGAELGYPADQLARLNRKAISLMAELREVHARLAPDRDQRLPRPAGGRLQPGRGALRRRGSRLSLGADRHLRRDRGGDGHGDHDDLRRRGDRDHAGRGRRPDAGGDLVHDGDRRPAAQRPAAGRGDRPSSTTAPAGRPPT